jgi:hypothetical protein
VGQLTIKKTNKFKMKKTSGIEVIPFLIQGDRKVIKIIVWPQMFASEEQAKSALQLAVEKYKDENRQPCNTFYEKDNPFQVIIIYGMNS